MATPKTARPLQPPSTADGPAVRRRLRHVSNFAVHSLTATPHKDEVLQAAAAGSLGWQVQHRSSRDDGAATVGDGRASGRDGDHGSVRQRSLDDLDLVGKGRRRGASTGSAKSLHIPPSSPSAQTSPLLPSSSSFGALPSTSSSASAAPRRPSLSRARASSRLSWHGRPPSGGSPQGLPDDLRAVSPTLSPTVARFRSRSVTRPPAAAGDLVGRAFVNEAEAIAEGPEELTSVLGLPPLLSPVSGEGYFALDEERERALRDAGERLLESFITLRLANVRASELQARQSPVEAGPSGTLPLPGDAEVGRRRSEEVERKGKYREQEPSSFGQQPGSSSSAASSDDTLSTASASPSRMTSRRTSISTHPSSPPTPRPKPDLLSIPLAAVDAGRPETSTSNPHATPFYISHPHRPATNPRFPELAPDGSDFAPWARESGAMREDTVGVELWVRRRVSAAEPAEEVSWSLLKEWEVRLNDLKRWDGRTILPPNTLMVRFLDEPALFYIPPPATSAAEAHRLERVASEPELHKAAGRQKVVEWSGAEEAILRSLRETRMKAGVNADDLQRLLRTQAELEAARASLRSFRAEVDALMRDFDESDHLRRQTHQVEAQTRAIVEEQETVKAWTDDTRSKIARLREDVARRKQQLEVGRGVLRDEQVRRRELEASVQREESHRSDVQAYLHGAQGALARSLEAIFPIVPVANGRAQPVFTIVSVALPLPSHPKEPAPPLSLPSSQLPPGVTVDEESVAAALGSVALLIDRLANYLGTRLPYPFTCAGSRSLVKDPISEITGPTRLFPLYSKGIERYRFEYAVFLLNKNLELLMVGRGLRIMDLRHTLPNLMNLLLTVSSDRPMPMSSRELPRPAYLHSSGDREKADAEAAGKRRSSTTSTSAGPFDTETESESELAGGDDGDGVSDDAGDRTPRASEPSRGLFWGMGGGASAKSAPSSEKTAKAHRSRRGTLIARAFVGQGNTSKEREQADGAAQGPVATL